jgi:hypothetical protein
MWGEILVHNVEYPMIGLSTPELTEIYQSCMRMASENKITAKNTWELSLIDHIDKVFEPLPRTGTLVDFSLASYALETGIKIYACRVDSVHSEVLKILDDIIKGSANHTIIEEKKCNNLNLLDNEHRNLLRPKSVQMRRGKLIFAPNIILNPAAPLDQFDCDISCEGASMCLNLNKNYFALISAILPKSTVEKFWRKRPKEIIKASNKLSSLCTIVKEILRPASPKYNFPAKQTETVLAMMFHSSRLSNEDRKTISLVQTTLGNVYESRSSKNIAKGHEFWLNRTTSFIKHSPQHANGPKDDFLWDSHLQTSDSHDQRVSFTESTSCTHHYYSKTPVTSGIEEITKQKESKRTTYNDKRRTVPMKGYRINTQKKK